MDNLQIIDAFLQMQRIVLYDESVDLDHGTLCITATNKTPYDNYMYLRKNLSPETIHIYEEEFAKRKRPPSFLTYASRDFEITSHLLQQLGYYEYTNDQWMFIDPDNSPLIKKVPPNNVTIKHADTQDLLEDFLSVFRSSHQEDDLKNAYGSGDAFIPTVAITWQKEAAKKHCVYMVVYDGETPAACAISVVFDSIAYLTCVGTRPSYRKKGYAALMISEFLTRAKQNNCKNVFLTTEKNRYPFEYFSKQGFVDRFSTIGYTKKI